MAHLRSEAAKVDGAVHWPHGRDAVLAKYPGRSLPPDLANHIYVELPREHLHAQDRVEAVAHLHGYRCSASPTPTRGLVLALYP